MNDALAVLPPPPRSRSRARRDAIVGGWQRGGGAPRARRVGLLDIRSLAAGREFSLDAAAIPKCRVTRVRPRYTCTTRIMGEIRAVLCPRRRQVPLLVVTTLLVGVRTELVDPKFKEPITNVTAPVGREAMLSCVVQDLAGYKVAWLRVDTQTILTIASHVITKNHRISVSHSDHRTWFLHIREVRESDRGWYMCQINTDPMKSQIGYLEVVVPPDILDYDTSTDMVVMEGRNVTLRCAATGSPTPNITWRREDGQHIQLGNGEEVASVDGPSFNITKVNRLHMGSYLCIASNGVPPSVSKRIMLTVHFSPMIWVQNQLVGAREGQKLTLECYSEAFPKSINYWTRDQDKIVPQGGKYEPVLKDNAYKIHMKLTINSVSPADYGSYKCVSRNSLGDTDGSIKVYPISNSTSNDGNAKHKGKPRHNSGNDILGGNQDMLKDPDLKLRGRKENSGDVTDYDESSANSNSNSSLLLVILVALCLCLHHHPQMRTLHPA